MKSIRSLIVGLVIAAAFAISLIGASAASAQIPTPSDAGVLVFHGGATLGGTIPGGVPPATGGSGSFSFEGDADASLVISDPGLNEPPEPGDPVGFVGHIHATGSYQNTVCGTASASGDATVGTDDGNVYAHFRILFVATVGVMLVDTLSTDDGDVGAPLPETGAGVIRLSNINNPGQPNECTGDTTGFQINGAAALAAFDVEQPSPPPPPPPGQYSNTCTNGTPVVDGYAGSAYVTARAQASPSDPNTTWVCYRVAAGGSSVGGRYDITGASGPNGVPSTDGSSGACQSTSGNAVPGPHPALAGAVAGTPFLVDSYAGGGAAWICLQAGSQSDRILVPVPSAGTPSVVSNADSPPPMLPADTVNAHPSGVCQSGTDGPYTRLANMNTGGIQTSAYVAQPNSSTVDLCARVDGPVGAGGVLRINTNGAPGVTPSVTHFSNRTPCTFPVLSLTSPVVLSLDTSPPAAAVPASVCITQGTTTDRYTVNVTGSPTTPSPSWTPDP